ncbi:hypothetical protein ZWY2020_013174 [Hordeum vulgare]|nr:hypothetical protein ZWY2020_013174 [Hordeum vulgare]
MDDDDQATHGGSSASAAMEETTRGDASDVPRMTRRLTHRPISRPIRNGPSTGSVGNNGSSQPASQTRKARTPRSRTGSGDRLEEIDRPLIVPSGIRWEKHPFKSREPSTVQGALVRQYYPEPIGPDDNKKPVLTWEDYKWSSNPRVQTAASRIKDEFWETFDNGMKNMHGENWQEEHPEFDGSVIYETTGRMPHGRLRIADEAFTKIDKSIIKATKIRVSQQEQSAREQERLQRENRQLRHENKELRGVAQVVRALIYRGGLDYDTLMEEGAQHESGTYDSEHEYYSDSDLYDELARQRDKVDQTGPELGPGSNAGSGDNHMEGGNINDESEST